MFARKAYDRDTIIAACKAVGLGLDDAALTQSGETIFRTKMRIRDKLGFKLENVQLPKRFFETPCLNGVLDETVAKEMIGMYATRVAAEMKA